jgi:hypothetical protein
MAMIPAGLAGVVAVGVTLAIERWGGRIGGILGSMPTTIVPASVGIYAMSESVVAFAASMGAVPAGMLVDALFLWCWRVLPEKLQRPDPIAVLWRVAAAAMTVWFVGACIMVASFSSLSDLGVAPLWSGTVTLAVLIMVGVAACWNAPSSPKGHRRVGVLEVASRGVLAAVAIGASVIIAKLGSPLVAGVASVFPAIFLTTMVSLWWSQGRSVSVGAVGLIMLGSSSVGAYALVAAWTFPAMGVVTGGVVAWCIAVVTTSVPAWWWLRRQARPA